MNKINQNSVSLFWFDLLIKHPLKPVFDDAVGFGEYYLRKFYCSGMKILLFIKIPSHHSGTSRLIMAMISIIFARRQVSVGFFISLIIDGTAEILFGRSIFGYVPPRLVYASRHPSFFSPAKAGVPISPKSSLDSSSSSWFLHVPSRNL